MKRLLKRARSACLLVPCLHLPPGAFAAAQSPAPADGLMERFVLVPGASRASYAVDEVFLRENNRLFTAVGVTPAVSGEVVIDRLRPTSSRIPEIVIDLRHLVSDSDRRDRALREKYLDTRRFPYARLTAVELTDLPTRIVARQRFAFDLSADLTLHGVTQRTEWRGEGEIAGDTLRGRAVSVVKMSAFDIEVPRLLSLRSSDDVKLEIHFTALRTPRRIP
jgi:polyisoprenoid-binding protein YceI